MAGCGCKKNTCCGKRNPKIVCGKKINVTEISYGVNGRIFRKVAKYVPITKCVSYSNGRQVICGGCDNYSCKQCVNNKLTCKRCCKRTQTCF